MNNLPCPTDTFKFNFINTSALARDLIRCWTNNVNCSWPIRGIPDKSNKWTGYIRQCIKIDSVRDITSMIFKFNPRTKKERRSPNILRNHIIS
ncbi:Uncharacterised protein [Klebsiella pneumoniae]|nr:Uncharacterised protein [Klebsiella pneumoniae]SWT41039.1 Uncharacterised protein [Klebsiella pneumoniae]